MRNFKKILKTAGLFLLAVCLLSAGFITCYVQGENFHYQDGRERDELAGQIDFLVCGASYTLFGIRPDIIDANFGTTCYNLSGTLMTMEGRCTLLKKELARNPVKTVILEVSPDTLLRDRAEEGPKGDLPMLGRLNTNAERWAYFRSAFTWEEWPEIYYDMTSKGMESALRLLTGRYASRNEIVTRGYYHNTKADKPIPNNYRDLFHAQRLPEQIIQENVDILNEMVSLCREKGAEIYLVTTPQSKYYNCINANLDYYEAWFTAYAAEQGIPYYNFNLLKYKLQYLPDETCFYDETHLNSEGGKVFTHLLADLIRMEREGSLVPQEHFFESYEALSWYSDYN